MLPKKLILKGINSYQETCTIDFERLMAGQLFGIFGAVGSGKSTILEAMTLALYGETERLNARDNRGYNLMNLRSNELLIDFTFESGQPAKTYRFVTASKRKKNFDKVSPFERKAYELAPSTNEWRPIDPQRIEALIGLSYPNFRRTIIIPQGKFQEFLHLGAKDRTQMLKEIFGLEQFDLSGKVSSLEYKNGLQLEKVKGGLKQYEALDEPLLAEQKEKGKELKKKVDVADKTLEQLLLLIRTGEQYLQLDKELLTLDSNLSNMGDRLLAIDRQREQLNLQVAELETRYAQSNQLEQQKKDFEFLLKVKEGDRHIRHLESKIQEGNLVVQKILEECKLQESKVGEGEQKLSGLKESPLPIGQLIAINNWHSKRLQMEQRMTEQAQQLALLQKEIAVIFTNLKAPLAAFSLNEKSLANIDLKTAVAYYQKKKVKLVADQESITKEGQNIVHLKELADAVQENQPCPLCGATHHPSIHNSQKGEAKREQLAVQYRKLKKEIEELEDIIRTFDKEEARLHEKRILQSQWKQRHVETQEHLAQHLAAYSWSNIDKADATAARKLLEKAEQQQAAIEATEKIILNARQNLKEANQRLEEKKQANLVLEREKIRNQSERDTLIQHLSILKWEDFEMESVEEIKSQIIRLNQQMKTLEQDYLQGKEELSNLEQQAAVLRGQQQAEVANKEKKTGELDNLKGTFQKQLEKYQEPLPIDLPDYGIDENRWQQLQEYGKTQSSQLQLLRREQIELDSEVKQLSKQLGIKRELQTELKQLEERGEHIRMLKNLFKGSGFVNYISSIYLRELCEAANHRFRKLTRNQLQLEITENNSFVVRDFLNQGKTRSVKTLSGGQLFQAALSLALALAESIRNQNNAAQNFFFMDEGFGSQDQESLQLVLKTLKALREENRIVGVISHVEELKREIDVFLSVENTEAAGSQVVGNWE